VGNVVSTGGSAIFDCLFHVVRDVDKVFHDIRIVPYRPISVKLQFPASLKRTAA
jgi:uncharacterized protein YpiB (UPF0302 family)